MLINLSKQEVEDIYTALMYFRYNMDECDKELTGFLERSERINKLIAKFVNECVYYSEN